MKVRKYLLIVTDIQLTLTQPYNFIVRLKKTNIRHCCLAVSCIRRIFIKELIVYQASSDLDMWYDVNTAINMKAEPLKPYSFECQSNCFVGQCRKALSKVKIDQSVNERCLNHNFVNSEFNHQRNLLKKWLHILICKSFWGFFSPFKYGQNWGISELFWEMVPLLGSIEAKCYITMPPVRFVLNRVIDRQVAIQACAI